MKFETIKKIKAYIQDHITEKISYDRLAKKFMCSNNAIFRTFKMYEGISLHDYVTKAKMRKAQEYIEEGYCARELPGMLSYKSVVAFRRAYKKEFGETPKKTEMRLRK